MYRIILNNAAGCHDLGKLNGDNQDVLTGRVRAERLPVEHRDAGVKYLLGDAVESPDATLVYAHHWPGLPNFAEEKVSDRPFRFPSAAMDSDENLQAYLQLHAWAVGHGESPGELPRARLSAMEYRILTSCLVDADYSDSAGTQIGDSDPRWGERLRKLDEYVRQLSQAAAPEHAVRTELRDLHYQCCREAPVDNPAGYDNGSVGTGKTTADLAHMLKAAETYNLRHIFIILPYTNLISQTVEVVREAVVLEGEDPRRIVAEHHHQADFESLELRHLAETWNAPITVTTAVQFFETLAASRPGKLRKLHQLPGSGVILDEYHAALPIHLMLPAWKWLTELVTKWGCHICMCSATTVRFWENRAFLKWSRLTAVPLLSPDVMERLNAFERSRVRRNLERDKLPCFSGMAELASYIQAFRGSKIVVLNTVRSAAVFARFLREEGCDVLHLSSALDPKDQEDVIHEIKRRLKTADGAERDWVLAATSGVECGMNFSFHYGFEELSSLQSCLQLLGRVRRNGEAAYHDAFLLAFTITEDKFTYNPGFSDGISVFWKMIDTGALAAYSDTEAVTEAFRNACKLSGQISDEICKDDKQKQFRKVSEAFRVIQDDTVTVIADQSLAERMRRGERVSARELQRGSVQIRKPLCKQLRLPDEELPVLLEAQYDSFLGYMKSLV